jgi:hypothetical protein
MAFTGPGPYELPPWPHGLGTRVRPLKYQDSRCHLLPTINTAGQLPWLAARVAGAKAVRWNPDPSYHGLSELADHRPEKSAA